MESLVPGRLPHGTLWTAALLLWLGTGTLGINEQNLRTIIEYITKYGVSPQYSFAISLNQIYCLNPQGLGEELPLERLQAMQNATKKRNGLYDPDEGKIVAARVNYWKDGTIDHSEWRLLQGDENSPVQKLLTRTYGQNSCLIFFTLNSPCVTRCLENDGPLNIIGMVNDAFLPIDNNFKAFVFQQVYEKDGATPEDRLDAWNRLSHNGNVPLFRCDNNGCTDCSGVNANCL